MVTLEIKHISKVLEETMQKTVHLCVPSNEFLFLKNSVLATKHDMNMIRAIL